MRCNSTSSTTNRCWRNSWIQWAAAAAPATASSTTPTSTTLGTCGATDTSTGSSYGNLTLVNDGWPKPSWQTSAASLGVPADGVRDLPDVSFFAGDGSSRQRHADLRLQRRRNLHQHQRNWQRVQRHQQQYRRRRRSRRNLGCHSRDGRCHGPHQPESRRPQGSPNTELYTLAGKQTYSSCSAEKGSASSACYFNDIDPGHQRHALRPNHLRGRRRRRVTPATTPGYASTGVRASASPNCTVVNTGDVIGTLSGYSAVTGYDQATGLGSLNIANVVNGWTALPASLPEPTPQRCSDQPRRRHFNH